VGGGTSPTARIASFASGLSFADLPAGVVARVTSAVVDTVGVAVAGSATEIGRTVITMARSNTGRPTSSMIGCGVLASADWAALANGTMAHALDYDDTNYGCNGHISAVLVPTALAVADEQGASGKDVITAYVAGFELASRLGRAIGYVDCEAGWHSTSTVGTLASALVASKLYGLDPRRTTMALGIAASQAAGVRANFGTMTKPLHVGLAARNGILAAKFARAGWESSDDALGGEHGFLDVFAPGRAPGHTFHSLGVDYDVETEWVAQKIYPSCAATHRPADAVLEIIHDNDLDHDQVDHVCCAVDRLARTYLTFPRPTTPEQARFSVEHTIAVALIDRRLGLEQYEPARIHDSLVRELASRVEVRVHPALTAIERWDRERFADVEIHMKNGAVHNRRVGSPIGHPRRPLSDEQVAAKFIAAVSPRLAPRAAKRLYDAMRRLDRMASTAEVTAEIRGNDEGSEHDQPA
jgi:2-methylcitrate dehydratase PrpD